MSRKPNVASGVPEHLGNIMRTARALNGVSMRSYAKRLNISCATLSRIERGKGCDLATLEHIHHETGIRYDILLGEKK